MNFRATCKHEKTQTKHTKKLKRQPGGPGPAPGPSPPSNTTKNMSRNSGLSACRRGVCVADLQPCTPGPRLCCPSAAAGCCTMPCLPAVSRGFWWQSAPSLGWHRALGGSPALSSSQGAGRWTWSQAPGVALDLAACHFKALEYLEWFGRDMSLRWHLQI